MTIPKKHFIIGALTISLAFVIQPFSLLFVQLKIAPKLAPILMHQNQDGTPVTIGKEIDNEDLKIRGNKDAKIYVVEFSDYQCPFCGRFHPTLKQELAENSGKIAWVWKYFPLTQIHPNAHPAAIAAECVFKLGGPDKFWSYSDTLIADQENLSDSLYKSEAAKLGIPAGQFATCLNDKATSDEVDKNTSEGETLGVSGTPSTFIVQNDNGKLTILDNINGALPKDTVDAAIAKYTK